MKKYLKVNFVPGPNFGDMIFPYMLRKLDIPFSWCHHNIEHKIISTGSIVEIAAKPNTIVWGSGIIDSKPIPPSKATYKAVRGYKTLEKINTTTSNKVAFGDPGLLLPEFYKPQNISKKYKMGIIPHIVNFDEIDQHVKNNESKFKNTLMLHPCIWNKDIEKFIDAVVSCDVIVATCLHGIICANAYGIPAIWLEASENKLCGDGIKFQDYYSSIGLKDIISIKELNSEDDNLNYITPNEDILKVIRRELLLSSPLYNLEALNDKYFTTYDNYKTDCYIKEWFEAKKRCFDPEDYFKQ